MEDGYFILSLSSNIIRHMSGHSKWATIHRQKEVNDAKRGQLFSKLVRAISAAAKQGGGNPESNMKLKLAIEQARSANMPKTNIERAISAAEAEAANLVEVVYEGYGPGGVAMMIEATTDNRNRTSQEIKNIFERFNGSLGGPGSVSFNFEPKGWIYVEKGSSNEQEQMLSLMDIDGIEDVEQDQGGIEVYTSPNVLAEVMNKLKVKSFVIQSSGLVQKPKQLKPVDAGTSKKLDQLLERLNDHEDVQDVFTDADYTA